MLRPSENDYDWLGHGIYFWESSPVRARDYAELICREPRRTRGDVRIPAVVGAVIDPGVCLNLLDAEYLALVGEALEYLDQTSALTGKELPKNVHPAPSGEPLIRHLDCAVIETLHAMRRDFGQPPFDAVRGVFVEGPPLYPGAGFHAGNHIQICVRNPRSIHAYFRVRE